MTKTELEMLRKCRDSLVHETTRLTQMIGAALTEHFPAPEPVWQAIKDVKPIEAIQQYRTWLGEEHMITISLSEAKEAVDHMRRVK